MSIIQFLRIVWAYRMMILITTVLSLVAAVTFVEVVKPRYVAQSRVMLDVIKPDPVTGQVMATAFLRAYTKTQIELVKDQQVARRVVDDLNWAKDPTMQRAYRGRNGDADMDFNRWAAQQVIAGADASLIAGSNILEISYSSSQPEKAKSVADALRKAYIDMTLQSRREDARRNAEWYEAQAQKARTILMSDEDAKAKAERETGIVLNDDKTDLDSARLAALASQGVAPVVSAPTGSLGPAETQLATLDAQIAEASKTLGPNHPALQALKAKRAALATQAAQERNTSAAAAGAARAAASATAGMLEQQKAKVMANRDAVERLRLMQDEIDLRRDQYNKAVARAAQLRQEAEVDDAGVVPLGNAVTPQSPDFPKKGLTVGASVPIGASLGVLVALILELVGRRVRSADDLQNAIEAPVLAVIVDPNARRRFRWSSLIRTPASAIRFRPRVARS